MNVIAAGGDNSSHLTEIAAAVPSYQTTRLRYSSTHWMSDAEHGIIDSWT